MWALDQPYVPPADSLFAGTPRVLLTTLAVATGAALLMVRLAILPPEALAVVGVAAAHGGLLATALAWARVGPARRLVAVALIGVAAAVSHLGALGALAYLGPALWVWLLSARGQLTSLGLGPSISFWKVAVGGVAGAGLAGHLLLSASRTQGLHVRVDHAPETLAAIAYDLGANVLAAECFFRGALFDRARRRWSFATASTIATSAYVLRYLIDPLLPKSVELVLGAVFYLALLGAFNCWLLAWSGSLRPGLVSAAIFFAGYRALGVR